MSDFGDWREHARCADADPGIFFPGRDEAWVAEAAKAVCARCPVADECLQWAFDNNVEYGVWGGMTERERFRLRRRVA